jgi:hypothetical protein
MLTTSTKAKMPGALKDCEKKFPDLNILELNPPIKKRSQLLGTALNVFTTIKSYCDLLQIMSMKLGLIV